MKIKRQTLVFLDTRERELWTVDLESANDQALFYFEPPALDSEGRAFRKWDRPKVAFADIDQDGKREAACFLNHDDPSRRALALFDHDGRKFWENRLDYREIYPKGAPTNDFRLLQAGIDDVNGDGRPEVLALWNHDRDFPGVFEIYSIEGERIFQYDHTGVLQFFAISSDPENGAAKEIYLGGTNNLVGGDAVLVVLSGSDTRSGLGPPYAIPAELRPSEKKLETFVPQTPQRAFQKRYLRFRHNPLSDALRTKWMNVTEIHASPEGLLVQVENGIGAFLYYRFDSGGRLLLVTFGADSERIYQDLFARKAVPLPATDFLRDAEDGVFAWSGEDWAQVPKAPR